MHFQIKTKQLKAALVALIMVVGLGVAMPASTYAATAATWTSHPASDDTQPWRGVTWSPELGIFTSVGGSKAMTSVDGSNWIPQTTPGTTHTWRGIAWSPQLGMFAVVGTDGVGTATVMTSPNGTSWTLRDPGIVGTYMGVTWSPQQGKFVATAAPAAGALTSTDGITWTPAPAPPSGGRNVIWSARDNQYVSTRSPVPAVFTSPDGETWTSRVTPVSSLGITYSETSDLYVAVGSAGIMTSNDAITWTTQTSPVTNLRAVVWSPENEEFVAVGLGGIVTSSDGVTWTQVTAPSANTWDAITWSPELFRYVATSIDGTNRTMVGIVPTVASAPLDLTAVQNGQDIDLSWTPPSFDGNSAITGYQIERSLNGGAFSVLVEDTASAETSYKDTDVLEGGTYTYRIYALNAEGQSAASNTASVQLAATLAETGVSQYVFALLTIVALLVGSIIVVKSRKLSH